MQVSSHIAHIASKMYYATQLTAIWNSCKALQKKDKFLMCNMLNVYAFLYFIPTFILFVGGRVILMANRKEFVGSIPIQGQF